MLTKRQSYPSLEINLDSLLPRQIQGARAQMWFYIIYKVFILFILKDLSIYLRVRESACRGVGGRG